MDRNSTRFAPNASRYSQVKKCAYSPYIINTEEYKMAIRSSKTPIPYKDIPSNNVIHTCGRITSSIYQCCHKSAYVLGMLTQIKPSSETSSSKIQGQPYLSSTTASSWYFNPRIPEAQTYYNRLQNNDLQLIQPTAAEEEILLSQPPNLEQKTVEELLNIDPDMFPPEGYRCTVTISRIVQNSKLWYPSCSRCHKSSSQTSTGYHCTSCGCTDINFRYKLSFIATDGTCEAEFFCFDSIARKIVGKPCDNLVTAVATSQGPPAALAAIVCLKFTLAVTINMSAYSVTNRVFSILSILTNQ
ncbi:hypothetical protein ZEAMMB73_Zm00001d049787 [Zea mays]|uniref:Replication factor A C-terminal domain-containing protein n=1 Tax=Zea mays TaxID=4577 RepID=A0A1D6PY52_MAIZE|nr:hypothetical protein ZEAMMB73_Zm00001d049787 [Zea mays]AQK51381.1 hypothetical protein ZEAMMB73_Zm00001d049787 [Zea mays]AQK51382.1 hypothetical protein ZEAMMB73_Zm00001d049787 [Zea mays]AQK51383.1 hypothetical protein ZEAMMB73_Zm00001d049787 [Zea mays]AQK51384.1 hypothetical protein ZEAMMB73_Zm00001d049787 [Zea mays]